MLKYSGISDLRVKQMVLRVKRLTLRVKGLTLSRKTVIYDTDGLPYTRSFSSNATSVY